MKKKIFALMVFGALLLGESALAQTVIYTPDTSGATTFQSSSLGSTNGGARAGSASALNVDTSACKRLTIDGASAIFSCFLGYLNYISIVLLAAAVAYTIYAAFKLVQSEEGRDEAKKTILYGVVAIFVMTSVWGLVNILANTFDVSSGNTAKSPVQLVK